VVNFLPTLNRRFLSRHDQQYILSAFSTFASSACAVLLQAEDKTLAMEILEQSRTIILSQLIGDRSDYSELTYHHPSLAKTFKTLLEEINTPVTEINTTSKQAMTARLHEAVKEYDACLSQIRELPAFERFLLGPKFSEMQSLARDGIIIVLNITDIRSDCILTLPHDIKIVNLPRKVSREARVWQSIKWSTKRRDLRDMNAKYKEYLEWLWKSCIKSILDAAGIGVSTEDQLPRIWWIGVGLASSIPLHAAGIHDPGSTENVFCRAISSYTPSFRALQHSWRMNTGLSFENGILATTMINTPNAANLAGVIREVDEIETVIEGRISISRLAQPSAAEVIEGLRHCSMAHFACHGKTNLLDPAASGLIFQDAKTGAQDMLTVNMISELDLTVGRVTYLSACSTAENRAVKLAEEAIHVVSGFQVAGFQHVIGCLWPSLDNVCVDVAKGFYSSLSYGGGSNREVAAAVHTSILAVRSRMYKQPLKWAQFVHYGA
jgi:hypothetical protein